MAEPESGTDFWESVVKSAAEEMRDAIKYLLAQEAPRPLGSERVSEKEQALTYSLMRDNPEALHAFFVEQNASFDSAVKYVRKMRTLLGEDDGSP